MQDVVLFGDGRDAKCFESSGWFEHGDRSEPVVDPVPRKRGRYFLVRSVADAEAIVLLLAKTFTVKRPTDGTVALRYQHGIINR